MNANELKKVIAVASDIYKAEFSQITVTVWMTIFKEHNASDIQDALMAHISDPEKGRFAPKPADLLGKIEKMKTQGFDLAMLSIQRAVKTVSARVGVAFDDVVTHSAMASLGGWPRAYTEVSNQETCGEYFAAFAKAYAKAKEFKSPHPAFLPGVGNQTSYACVGDQDRCDAVVSSGYNPVQKVLAIS